MSEYTIGSIVKGRYKTGSYVGEITAVKQGTVVVRVLAVRTHPTQGDLHQPNTGNVPFFQERKALAKNEQANMAIHTIQPFHEDVPDYKTSLKNALSRLENQLLEHTDALFRDRSLTALNSLKSDYGIESS
ncbi:sporulation phosphorelay system protein KapB [Aureibacillus halotolerans]|uniref:Kinase-associated protein B n=1 Tax=Aureibacillus halotolerans TaxID=1508390 RepID=A0A4R6U255_9BACI|nr:sporulation phosphorelay system protein KapB [Aureibacillus halotolerans]TDQ40420.1 kinase-associated protein B [Aureibacillus halotolerans]